MNDLVPHVVPDADLAALGFQPTFSPAQAALILRDVGLTEMTECALRTRAYRRQVPFHLNGHRIRFTAADLREIAEGQAQRPDPIKRATEPRVLAQSSRHRALRSSAVAASPAWRARDRGKAATLDEAS